MPARGRMMTIVSALATIGLIAAVVYYGSRDEYAVLFSDLKPENASVIVEKLKAESVPHEVSNGGTTISIPGDRISEMRLKMAGEGVLSGGHVGFDLFDKTTFGATDFAQKVNFRRAVEGELARTLEGMDEVEAARVHVTAKKESVFTETEEGAKASVVLRVQQNKQLSSERTAAVVALVASSVEGLDPSSVSVLDTRGRLLTAATNGKNGQSDAGNFADQLDSKRKFESEMAARVVSLIEPVAGDGGVRADVSADVDFSQVEKTEEKFDPQSQVVRSQKTATEKTVENATSGTNNVAGARGNDPTATVPTTGQQTLRNGNDERQATTTNYEIDRTITKTIGGGGRVNRLNVSVVVDHKMVSKNRVARTAGELSQIEQLVTAAVGIDPNRGDTIVVQTMPFDQGEAAPAAATATFLSNNKDLISTSIKYGVLVLVTLILILFVFRPAKKALRLAIANSGGRRLSDGEGAITDKNRQLSESTGPLTVAELESQMNSQSGAGTGMVKAMSAGGGPQSLDSIKNILTSENDENSEVVVGTLRGWLRE